MFRKPGVIGISLVLVALILFLGYCFGWTLSVGLFAAAVAWGMVWVVRGMEQETRAHYEAAFLATEARLADEINRHAEERRRLDMLLQLNRTMADNHDERPLMDAVLTMLNETTGALGSSFVPVDEWQQPLPPFTSGQLPDPVLRAWSLHLASGMLRERCGACQALKSEPGGCPLHPEEVGGALTVYCQPLRQINNGRGAHQAGSPLGVLHFYFPPDRKLDAEMRGFLDHLLPEIALLYENAHLRAQEATTMRQIQMLHGSNSEFTSSLGGLLDGLRDALEADCIMVRLQPSSDERFSNLQIVRGNSQSIPKNLHELSSKILEEEQLCSAVGELPAWLALPLRLPEGPIFGLLLIGANHPRLFHPRQKAISQTVAAQAALLVENERLLRSLEYKVIIQERIRLAREIHDGLAQTLAFLKLQSAQMQSYLSQGDLDRLAAVLKDSHQALAEAYLDTRQSIDNLRLTPQEGLLAWLDRALREFETAAGVRIERYLDPGAKSRSNLIPQEIQAQLIRIVQEAFSNIRKHARASSVRVTLHVWRQDLILEIADDGIGFEADDVPEISRHGLRGMRERAELIGAEFQVISQARQGTTVRLVIPVRAEEVA